jgi:hypothetical protein
MDERDVLEEHTDMTEEEFKQGMPWRGKSGATSDMWDEIGKKIKVDVLDPFELTVIKKLHGRLIDEGVVKSSYTIDTFLDIYFQRGEYSA